MVVRQEWKGQENGGAGAKEGAKSKSVTGAGERESVGASMRRSVEGESGREVELLLRESDAASRENTRWG